MSSGSGASAKVYKQDGKTTYCYYTNDKYTSDLSAVAKSNILSTTSGSRCPVQLTVTYPLQVDKNKLIPLNVKAVVNDKDKPAEFEFPLTITKASVPSSLLASSNNATVAPSGSAANGTAVSKLFDVPIANFVICDYRNCDIFTDSRNLQGNFFSSSNNPQDFADRVASFSSNELTVPKQSKYTGYAHIVVNIAGVSRADFVTFFPVQIGDLPGEEPSDALTADSKTTYCWVSIGRSPFEARIDDTSITVRTNANCPGSMTAALSKTSVLVGEKLNVDFSLQLDATRTPTSLVGEVSGTDAIQNPTTGVYSVVPVAVVSSCLQNSEDKTTTCSTYSGGTSRTVDLKTWADQNMTSGIITLSTSQSFDQPGQYLIISRVAMQTLDGNRIDMAVYSTMQVTIPESTSGSLFLYIGLAIGALILLVGFLFCFMRKRRQRRKMKDIPFRTPMPPASVLERSSQYTATSSNFVTHREPQMNKFPIAYPQHENNPSSFYPVDNDHDHDYRARPQKQRSDSFSLDPYSRNSFNDMPEGESLDMTIRPSDASKFSFQTGYDDQSDWEYDTRSFQSEGTSEFSDVQRGTFHLHAGASNALPIMEEDDMDRRYMAQRSTTSSGWTVRS